MTDKADLKTVYELLKELQTFAPERTGPGQPAYEELPGFWLFGKRPVKIAMAVRREQLRLGGGRGSKAQAIRNVALKQNLHEDTVSKYVMRFGAKVVDYVDAVARMTADLQEIERRMARFPVDVKDKLEEMRYADLLEFLRREGINGDASHELIDKVRSL